MALRQEPGRAQRDEHDADAHEAHRAGDVDREQHPSRPRSEENAVGPATGRRRRHRQKSKVYDLKNQV
jgi:hypothetical protein